MRYVRVMQTFEGYPSGAKRVLFTKGEEREVSNEYFEQQKEKGLFEEIGTTRGGGKPEAEQAPHGRKKD